MIAELTPDRVELAQLVRRFIADRSPLSHTRQFLGTDSYDTGVWEQLSKELGLPGLAIPESHDGLGLGIVELGLVMTQLGRELYNGPFLSTVCLGVPALLECGADEIVDELLPRVAAGELTLALAFAEPHGSWDGSHPAAQYRADGATVRLSGSKTFVIDGLTADLLLVTAVGSDGGEALLLVDPTEPGTSRHALPTLDQTRNLARLDFDDAPARLVGTASSSSDAPLLRRVLAEACVLLAAEQLGAAERCLEVAVEYAATRMQFGRAIGSFQAIKHRCADMLLDVETARSAVLLALGAEGDELLEAASVARAQCSEVFSRAATSTVQIHGGIGFTWEHDAHLYLKRAKSSEVILGSPTEHRELVARLIGL